MTIYLSIFYKYSYLKLYINIIRDNKSKVIQEYIFYQKIILLIFCFLPLYDQIMSKWKLK